MGFQCLFNTFRLASSDQNEVSGIISCLKEKNSLEIIVKTKPLT